MEVEIRAWLVVRHVVNDTIKAERRAIGDREAETSEAAGAEIIGVAVRRRATLELVARANSTGAEDELALPAHQSDREVVVQACSESRRIDIGRPRRCAANGAIGLRRIVAITFELPAWIAEKNTESSAVADSVLRNRARATGVIVETAPLSEAAELNRAGEWGIQIVPPHVRRPHHRVTRCAATHQVAQIRRQLETSLRAEIELTAIGGQIIHESVNSERDTAEAEVESGQSVDAIIVGPGASVSPAAEVLENSARSNVEGREVRDREAIHQARRERARLHIAGNSVARRAEEAVADLRPRGRVRPVSLEVPVGRDESANPSAVTPGLSETGIQVPLAIEVRPRAEPSYQQRTGRLCCRRSAEE